jgi:Flp pilus assembly CpaE family ATPase
VVVLDQTLAFIGEELAGQAKVLVYQDTQPEDLAETLGAQATRTDQTTVMATVNIKGGTGKTSLTINLADALAQQGLKTIIVDADVADGDVAEALGVPSSAPTIDKLARELAQSNRDPYQLINQYIYERTPHFHILPAPGRSDYGQDYLNEMTAKAILDTLTTHHYDVVLVDLPGNVRGTPFTATLAGWSTCHFLLMYPAGYTFGQKGFQGGYQILTSLGVENRSQIVVLENTEEPWSKRAIEREYGLPVVAVLPFDPLVEKSQAAGKTVRELESNRRGVLGLNLFSEKMGGKGGYAQAIKSLAERIMANDFVREGAA